MSRSGVRVVFSTRVAWVSMRVRGASGFLALARADTEPASRVIESPVKLDLPPQNVGPEPLRLAAANGDARAQFEGFADRRRLQVGNIDVRGYVTDARNAADRTLLGTISPRDGEVQTVAVDQRSNDSAV